MNAKRHEQTSTHKGVSPLSLTALVDKAIAQAQRIENAAIIGKNAGASASAEVIEFTKLLRLSPKQTYSMILMTKATADTTKSTLPR